MSAKSTLPFVFTYRDAVYGNGFLAEVEARGRVLACEEDEGWWLYGVTPGDLAESGRTPAEVHTNFRKAFTSILFDIAEEAKGFAEFKSAVESFFAVENEPALNDWLHAVQVVRETGLAKHTDMPVVSADQRPGVSVQLKQERTFSTQDNVLEPEPALAA